MIKGIQPALAEGGKIKIGELGDERTSRNGKKWRAPVKLDHFLITGTQRDEHGDLRIDEALMGALQCDRDGLIRAIPIVLHSDNIDEVFPTSYAMYSGRKLACRGDGETATRWAFRDNARTSETKQCQCPCPYLNNRGGGPMCKPHGTLHCSIIAPDQAVAGAVHKWRTTSLISIQRMIGSLQQILATCGTMRGLPLWLKLEAIHVQPDGVGSSTVYCCHVELRAADLLSVQRKALELAQMRNALSGGADINSAYRALITAPAGDHETPEEQAEVADEFYPEGTVIDAEPEQRRPPVERAAQPMPTVEELRTRIAAATHLAELDPIAEQAKRLSPNQRTELRTLFQLKKTELQRNADLVDEPPHDENGVVTDDYAHVGPPPMTEQQQAMFEEALADEVKQDRRRSSKRTPAGVEPYRRRM